MIGRLPLRVFVSAGCAACRRAAELVETVRRMRPSQPIEMIDLDHHSAPVPDGVVGAPTFLLGQQVVSLGNPTLEMLLATLDATAPATGS